MADEEIIHDIGSEYVENPLQEELYIVEQALTELKTIKEAKPSEALKCVDVLKEDECITTLYQGKALETIRQYILKAQEQEKDIIELRRDNALLKDMKNKQEKALEILKKKADFVFFGRSKEVKIEQVDSEDSLYLMTETGDTILPEEEYDTLKEIFYDELKEKNTSY